jgi:hypothetical protein
MSNTNQQRRKISDMYQIYLRTRIYVPASELPSSGDFLVENYNNFFCRKNPPQEDNSLAETYVRVFKYILYMSITLCLCWLLLDQ